MTSERLTRQKKWTIAAIGTAAALATGALGARAWYVMPTILFVGSIVMMLVWPRRRTSAGWVAAAAVLAIVLAVILKFV